MAARAGAEVLHGLRRPKDDTSARASGGGNPHPSLLDICWPRGIAFFELYRRTTTSEGLGPFRSVEHIDEVEKHRPKIPLSDHRLSNRLMFIHRLMNSRLVQVKVAYLRKSHPSFLCPVKKHNMQFVGVEI